MPDNSFLPERDREIVTWVSKFNAAATANSTMVAIPAASLSTFATVNTEFSNSILLVEQRKADLKAAVKAKNEKRKAVATQARTFNRYVQGRVEVTDSVKLSLGLKVRPTKPEPVVPVTPEKFQASGDSAGVNFLSWKAAGNKAGTQYEIWYREGTKVDWSLLYTSSKCRHEHKPVTPGMQVMYKVRAKRAERFSNFSAMAIVYPTPSVNPLVMDKAA